MHYSILGPLEVRDVSLGQGRQRLLLAVLLLHRNEVLSSERLIEALWGEAPPPRAAGSLHNLVSALRRSLGNGALVTHGHGYALTVAPGELDADEFEALSARGRAALADGDAGEAAELLREALALWRGPALGELAYDLPTAAGRLEDLKLGAVEDRIDADLALGRHASLIAEVSELVERHPERERLRGQQMLALYRCDRQAEALASYQDFRRRLGDELGLLPAPSLRALEAAILDHDPALAGPAPHRPLAVVAVRRPRWIAVAAAALVLAAPIVLLLRGGAAHPEPVRVVADSVVVIDPASNRITASYPVGATPSSVTVGGGAAWTVSADAQTISRIDLRERTTRTFATGSVPLEIAAGRDALWLVAADGAAAGGPFASAPALLTRIDPESAVVAGSTTLAPDSGPAFRGPPGLVAIDRDAVWTIGRSGRLSRLDRHSGQVSPVRGFKAMSVAAGDGQVWAVIETSRPSQRNLVRLDPASGRTLGHRLHVPWVSVAGIAVGAGSVWLTDPYTGLVWRVDPGPVPVVRTINVDFGVDSIAAAGNSVWAADGVTGTLSRLDPVANRVTARVDVGGTPRSVAIGAGGVWVAIAGGERRSAGPLPRLAKVRPLVESGCGPLLTAPGPAPDLLVVVDLPLQGQFLTTTRPMAAAVVSVLRSRGFRAGRFRVAVQTCDDSTAASNGPDAAKCTSNAKAYAAYPSVIGVVGPVHSFCAEAMLPVLNRAADGPISLVSPTNSRVSLVRRSPEAPAGHLRKLYPTGQRGYARVYPADDAVSAATVVAARQLGAANVFYLYDEPDKPWRRYFRAAARRNHLRIAGMEQWDADAASFRALARRVRDAGAQAVVLDGSTFFHVGNVLRDLRRVLGADFPILVTEAALPLTQLFDEAGPAARGVRVVLGGQQPGRLGASGRRFEATFGATRPDGRVSQWDVHAAAATEVLLDAIARSDGTRESVASGLATTRLADSVLGPLALDRRGEPTVTHSTVIRAERGGAPMYVDGIEGGVVEREITLPAGDA